MKNNCIICGEQYVQHRIKGLVKCPKCGFVSADIKLNEEEIEKLYSQNYFQGEEYADYILDKKNLQKNYSQRIKKIKKYVSSCESKKLYEIGCAYGFFLEEVNKTFWETAGIDISKDAVEYAKNVLKQNATSGDYLSHQMKELVDVICMWDTIEHLQYPELFIEKAYKDLCTDGILAVTTGDIGSLNARLRGRKWRQIHMPTHLHYFSVSTITELLKEKGFEIVYVGHPSNLISMNTILYTILVLRGNAKKLYNFLKKMHITELIIPVNMLDFMYIIARKKEN